MALCNRLALLSFFLAWPVLAGEIDLPEKVTGKPGKFIKVPATTKGAIVRWKAADEALDVFPVELLKDTKTAVVIGEKPGKYRLLAWTAIDGVPTEAVQTIVVIEGPEPPPVPPVPPVPPNDPLVQAVSAAWVSETDPAKSILVLGLANVYHTGAAKAADPTLLTWEALFTAVQKQAQALGVSGKLLGVQKAVAAEAVRVIPGSATLSGAITQAERTAAANHFSRAAAIVEVLK